MTINFVILYLQIAKYKCPTCGDKWKTKNSRGSPKICEGCGKTEIEPYDFIPNPKVKSCIHYSFIALSVHSSITVK